MVKNPLIHEKTKHMKLDCHFIPRITLIPRIIANTKDQLPNILTKSLSGTVYREIIAKLGVQRATNLKEDVTDMVSYTHSRTFP